MVKFSTFRFSLKISTQELRQLFFKRIILLLVYRLSQLIVTTEIECAVSGWIKLTWPTGHRPKREGVKYDLVFLLSSCWILKLEVILGISSDSFSLFKVYQTLFKVGFESSNVGVYSYKIRYLRDSVALISGWIWQITGDYIFWPQSQVFVAMAQSSPRKLYLLALSFLNHIIIKFRFVVLDTWFLWLRNVVENRIGCK